MGLQSTQTAQWYERASGVLINGVSSQFRYWGDDDTIVIDRGEGGHVYDMDGEPKEFRDVAGHDEDLYEDICFRMIRKGVMPCPDALEPWFVCAAHTDEDISATLDVFEESLIAALATRSPN